ncbi:hypothetical protein [Stenotrophomonas sp. STK17_22]|uniref:hypothetical protein n=1 Tax=Stenotrophomonas sp. STK17_22 TaxID=3455201 RepID=UPI003F7FB22B
MATYEQGLLYEAACELLNGAIGTLSTQISQAEQAPVPDAASLEVLKREQFRLGVLRQDLDAGDDAAVNAVIQQYRKPPQAAEVPRIHGADS